MLEFHFLLEGSWPRGNIAPVLLAQPAGVAGANSLPEQGAARVRRKRFEDALPDRRSSGETPHLKNGKRRGDRNVMLDQVKDRIVQGACLHVKLGDQIGILWRGWAFSRLFRG